MSSIEARNKGLAERWAKAWNEDAVQMVDDCYAENCEVSDMLRGRTFHGRDELRLIEEQMIAIDPTHRMAITRMVANGDTVAIEMDAFWDNDRAMVKSCVFLTFDADGMIVVDHSYGGDPNGAAEQDPR